jgi:hypothetical protein
MEIVKVDGGGEGVLFHLKDLRIGNILCYKGELVHVTCLSKDIDDEYQDTIYFCHLGTDTNEMGGWNRSLCTSLKPVELTVEVLLKLRFTPDDSYSIFEKDRAKVNFHIHDGTIDIDDNRVSDGLMYLHNLQNIYHAITNTEIY